VSLHEGSEGWITDYPFLLSSTRSPDLETQFSTLLKNLTDAFAVCACGGRTRECAISQLGVWVRRQRARRAALESAHIPANNPLPLLLSLPFPSLPSTAIPTPASPRTSAKTNTNTNTATATATNPMLALSGLHPSHYHHPEPTLPIHPAHTGAGAVAAVMGSAGFGVATGGDVSEEEDEALGMVPGPTALPRSSFARAPGQVRGQTQEGVVRGQWAREGGYAFPPPRLGCEGEGFVVRGEMEETEETEMDMGTEMGGGDDRPRTATPRPVGAGTGAGSLGAPIELMQERETALLPGETTADALRRIKGIDLGVLVGSSRGVRVLRPEHGGMHGVRIDERWGRVRSGDVRTRGQQQHVQVCADPEAFLGREKRKRADEEEDGRARKRVRRDVEMSVVVEQVEVEVVQNDEVCETYVPPRARKGWKSFRQRFEQRGACLSSPI
jgi:hypothetical protein